MSHIRMDQKFSKNKDNQFLSLNKDPENNKLELQLTKGTKNTAETTKAPI